MKSEKMMMFHIELNSYISNTSWEVVRSYSDFINLNINLIKGFLDVPALPKLVVKSEQDANVLRLSLHNYLLELVGRADFINSQHLKNFLELDHHCTSFMQFQPMLLHELSEEMEVIDINFCSSQKLLFVGMAYSSITGRISSYFNSISSLWSNSNLGAFSIYHIATSSYGELHMEKIFYYDLASQVSKIKFVDDDSNFFIIGLFDGSIIILRLLTRDASNAKRSLVDFVTKIKPHKSRIIDFALESNVGYIYSAAFNEKNICISEINYNSVISSYNVSNYYLNSFTYDKDSKRIFTTDTNRSLWILQVENGVYSQ